MIGEAPVGIQTLQSWPNFERPRVDFESLCILLQPQDRFFNAWAVALQDRNHSKNHFLVSGDFTTDTFPKHEVHHLTHHILRTCKKRGMKVFMNTYDF